MTEARRLRSAIEAELTAINALPAALLRRAFSGGREWGWLSGVARDKVYSRHSNREDTWTSYDLCEEVMGRG